VPPLEQMTILVISLLVHLPQLNPLATSVTSPALHLRHPQHRPKLLPRCLQHQLKR
jgi:hypothetical protein